jgi:hypothetical protein
LDETLNGSGCSSNRSATIKFRLSCSVTERDVCFQGGHDDGVVVKYSRNFFELLVVFWFDVSTDLLELFFKCVGPMVAN